MLESIIVRNFKEFQATSMQFESGGMPREFPTL